MEVPFLKSLLSLLSQPRHASLARALSPHLAGRKILDLGAGDAALAKQLQERTGCCFTCVDTNPQPKTLLPVQKYSGKTVPFAARSFDCVMLVDVLHHSENPALLLAEAKRLSRGRILIKDHYWENRLDFLLLCLADYVGNKPHGTSLPYNFLDMRSWRQLASSRGLRIARLEKLSCHPLDPCKHVLIQLEK